MNSIEEQKKYLSENLVVEKLRMYGSNQRDIKNFLQAVSGNTISEYLNNKAWNDDVNNDTKVFLVRDKTTREIAYYYALSCGILYKELDNTIKMSFRERECVGKLIEAIRLQDDKRLNDAERDTAWELLSDAYGLFDTMSDTNRASYLVAYAQEQAKIKEQKEEALKQVDEENVKNVQETYPAIDIKFLCKNANYKPKISIDFKFGVYVFWEIIVPHILKISELVGCKYVYLFAADNSESKPEEEQSNLPIMYSKEYNIDIEDDDISNINIKSEPELKKLVSYYMNNLKFHPVSEYIILKPHFERTCYTLVQSVTDLLTNRERVWGSYEKQ